MSINLIFFAYQAMYIVYMRYDFAVKQSTTYLYPYEKNCCGESPGKKNSGSFGCDLQATILCQSTFRPLIIGTKQKS